MESNLAISQESDLAVVPASAPDPVPTGEGATLISRYLEPVFIAPCWYVNEWNTLDGKYVRQHGPYRSEDQAFLDVLGTTISEIEGTLFR